MCVFPRENRYRSTLALQVAYRAFLVEDVMNKSNLRILWRRGYKLRSFGEQLTTTNLFQP